MVFIENLGKILIILIPIIILVLIVLIILEKRLKNKIRANNRNKFYLSEIREIDKTYYKKSLESINKIARDFFEEAFKIRKSMGYSELKKYFDQNNNSKAAEFSEIMNILLYSKEKDNSKIQKLINLLIEIAETNEIISEAEQILRKGEISSIGKKEFKNEKNNGNNN